MYSPKCVFDYVMPRVIRIHNLGVYLSERYSRTPYVFACVADLATSALYCTMME